MMLIREGISLVVVKDNDH